MVISRNSSGWTESEVVHALRYRQAVKIYLTTYWPVYHFRNQALPDRAYQYLSIHLQCDWNWSWWESWWEKSKVSSVYYLIFFAKDAMLYSANMLYNYSIVSFQVLPSRQVLNFNDCMSNILKLKIFTEHVAAILSRTFQLCGTTGLFETFPFYRVLIFLVLSIS